MHRNAAQVVSAAAASGLTIEVRTFPDGTRTAADAAAAVDASIDQIVKSLVFLLDADPARPVLALVAGGNRLDEHKLAQACSVTSVGRADADAVRAATGFPIGGVPPFGHPTRLMTVADRTLLDHDEVWAAAGTPRDVFAVAPRPLVEACGAQIVDLAEH